MEATGDRPRPPFSSTNQRLAATPRQRSLLPSLTHFTSKYHLKTQFQRPYGHTISFSAAFWAAPFTLEARRASRYYCARDHTNRIRQNPGLATLAAIHCAILSRVESSGSRECVGVGLRPESLQSNTQPPLVPWCNHLISRHRPVDNKLPIPREWGPRRSEANRTHLLVND